MTESENTELPAEAVPFRTKAAGGTLKQLRSTDLFSGRQEIEILHAGETYRLRMTRSGKLILTK